MMRKRIGKTVVLLGFLAVLLLGARERAVLPKTVAQVQEERQRETQESSETGIEITEYKEESKSSVQSDIALILEYSTKAFFCGYPVEEGFFSWIAAEYGAETLETMAERLQTGDSDRELWYQLTGNSMHVLWVEYARSRGFASYVCDNVTWKEASDPSCIKLDFVGDINFGENWYTMQTAEESGGVANCISEAVRTELESADITMVNNEFAYSNLAKAQEGKDYCFETNPLNVRLLDLFGTDIVSVANNHVFDYGDMGFLQTLETLRAHGTVVSGGGENLSKASAPQYFIVGGRKIAIVSATEIERYSHYTKEAGEDSAGVLKTQQESTLKNAIRSAAKTSDYVIAYIHWGEEGQVYYGSDQEDIAKLCVDAGADAVIGGHPHRMQGVSFVDDVPVVYSLGNFWFSTGTLYTTIAQIQIDGDGELSLSMLPCIQKDVRTYMLESEEEKKEFYHYLADISSNVGIDEDGRIHSYMDVTQPGISPYAYTSGRRYGMRVGDVDLDMNSIDIVGNKAESQN